MLLRRTVISLILTAFLYGSSKATPHLQESYLGQRDDPASSSAAGGATLEPVVPPDVKQDDLATLTLDTQVRLAWAGSTTGATSRKRFKRDGAILTQADFTFKYPTVPIDHSSFITGVSCSSGILTGVLTDKAYAFARKQWAGVSDIVFVTSVDGCGLDNADEFFHAKSITFSDSNKSFSAKGSSARYKTITDHMNLKWGDIGTSNLKRAADQKDMFEPHPLHKRAYADVSISWDAYLDKLLGEADDAPWDNAALLWKWGKEGGEEDDSYKKGEVADPNGHHKRWNNETEIQKREVDYGLALYCVECGFGGSATIWGEIDASILFFELNTVQAGFKANFKAGLNLGMEAYVKYEKEWEKELARIPLGGFSIPLLVDVGPFVSVGVEAKAGISATGTLLIGAAVAWDDIDIMLDLLHSSNSRANGLVPRFEHKAEAAGELKIEASLGLPIKLGVGISLVEGLWDASAAIVDTPSIVAEGKFEVSASVTDDGKVEHDINGGCYGIAWDIHFENTLEAVLEADGIGELPFELIKPQESDPIAEGCIGYVNDGTDDDDTDVNGVGSGTGMSGNGLNSGGNGLAGGAKKASGSSSQSSSSTSTTSASSGPQAKLQAAGMASQSTSSSSTTSTTSALITTIPTTTKSTIASLAPQVQSVASTSKTTSASTSMSTSKSSSSSSTTIQAQSAAGIAKASSSTTTKPVSTTAASISGKASATTTSKASACSPSQVVTNPSVPAGLTCNKIVAQASVAASYNVGKATTVNTVNLCAANCLKTGTQCVSFSFNDKKSCQLYNKAVKSVAIVTKKGEPQLAFYDKACYTYSTCPK